MDKQEMKFWARMFENAPNMSSEVRQGWIDNPKGLQKFLSGLVPPETRLSVLGKARVHSSGHFLPDFFKNRKGLAVSKKFTNLILSGIQKQSVTNKATYAFGYADLKKSAFEDQIWTELPEGFVFENVDAFLSNIATLIENQWDGKEGVLLANGMTNIFFVKVQSEVYTVNVCCQSGDNQWRCSADSTYTTQWHAGNRVFSASDA